MNNPYFSLIKSVWRYGKPWRKFIIGYYLAYIIARISLSLSPYAFGQAIQVVQNFTPDKLNQVIFWLVMGVVVILIFWLFHGPARVIERNVAQKIKQAFRAYMYEQITYLPLKWHQEHHSGNIITRLNYAARSLNGFAEDQFIYIETIVGFLVTISFLLWISLPVGILSLCSCIILIFVVVVFDRQLIPLYRAQNEIESRVGAVFFDYIGNMTTIITLRLKELTKNNLVKRMLEVWPFFKKDAVINELKWFTVNVLLVATQAIILIGYILYELKTINVINIGIIVMIFRYQHDLNEVFYTLSHHYSELVRMNTEVRGVDAILDDIKRLAHAPKGATIAQKWHQLSVKHLEFCHISHTKKKQVFKNLNFSIKRGEKIALIGTSGGGKSTLLNLLCGLYVADKVNLEIDGISFDTLEPLQSIATLIPQDPEIFENTVAFNINLDLPAAAEDLNAAINIANFAEVLANLPHGLETDIREKGLNLSVGQKQRLALARGLFAARFSSLILMDEPTSSVDLATENKIISGVIDAFPNSGMLISLHRLHLLPKFDRIIMLRNGQILADGIATELLAKPGPVRDLWLAYRDGTDF